MHPVARLSLLALALLAPALAVPLTSCALADLNRAPDLEDVDIDVTPRAASEPVPTVAVEPIEAPPGEPLVAGEALNELPNVDGAAVEERVKAALAALPALARDVQDVRVSETDTGLSVTGYVRSAEAFDDVEDLVSAAAPGVPVENDLVVVLDLG